MIALVERDHRMERDVPRLAGDLEAEASLAAGDWAAFLRTLRQRGRARVTLRARVPLPDGGVATEMQARYVAILRPSAAA